MSGVVALTDRGFTRDLGAFVVAVAFNRAGSQAAFGLGDGSVHLAPIGAAALSADWARVEAHDGAVMALVPDAAASGFASAGDDGRFIRIGAGGGVTEIFASGGKWIEQAASVLDGKDGYLACAAGRVLHLFSAAGARLRSMDLASTVTGIAFDGRGKRIAVSHYNGASVWFTASTSSAARVLTWKGSHTGVTLHPAGEAVVTSMQENALHGWRLADTQHMRMTGYPSKTESMGFSRSGKWLASSGADAVVLWPFFGGGPMGKPPLELAQIENVICTRVACHPKDELVAAGYADGTVLIVQIASGRVVMLAEASGVAISALAWSPEGGRLAAGREDGWAALFDLTAR